MLMSELRCLCLTLVSWEFGKITLSPRWYDSTEAFFSQFHHSPCSSSVSQYFYLLCQSDLVASFHFPFPLSKFFQPNLPFLCKQLPSFIMLFFPISSPFHSSGFIAYFVSYSSHLLSPCPSSPFLLKQFLILSLLVPINASLVHLLSFWFPLSHQFSFFSPSPTTAWQFFQMLSSFYIFAFNLFFPCILSSLNPAFYE